MKDRKKINEKLEDHVVRLFCESLNIIMENGEILEENPESKRLLNVVLKEFDRCDKALGCFNLKKKEKYLKLQRQLYIAIRFYDETKLSNEIELPPVLSYIINKVSYEEYLLYIKCLNYYCFDSKTNEFSNFKLYNMISSLSNNLSNPLTTSDEMYDSYKVLRKLLNDNKK